MNKTACTERITIPVARSLIGRGLIGRGLIGRGLIGRGLIGRGLVGSLAMRLLAAVALTLSSTSAWSAGGSEAYPPTRVITQGPGHHWFGYYDKFQFDVTGRYVLSMVVDFEHRSPTAEDVIRIGMVDLHDNDAWIDLGESRAWNWQQGCMLQWLPGSDTEILWNDRQGDRFVCHIMDVFTREQRTIEHPIYSVSPDGKWAVSADFRRIQDVRPGYGYAGLTDPHADDLAPVGSGLFRIDLRTGESELIVSIDQIASLGDVPNPQPGIKHYFNHLLINPDGSRFIALHRWRYPDGKRLTRMITANPDGSDIRIVIPNGYASHFIWRDPGHILSQSRQLLGEDGWANFLFEDKPGGGSVQLVGNGVLDPNGHVSYLPGGQWILNDTYPQTAARVQIPHLYHVKTGARIDLGRFPVGEMYRGEWRVDTHPRLSRDGKRVCIDAPDGDRGRQLHLIDIRDLVADPPIDIGTRLQPLVDSFLIAELSGDAAQVVQQPQPREVVLVTDAPWEGNTSAYYTIFQDGDLYRMYYRGSHYDTEKKAATHREVTCYAESRDGITWTKPNLKLYEFEGSKNNNIVWDGIGTHCFAPFLDTNPDCPPESRYKALSRGRPKAKKGLYAFQSADGIRWSLMHEEPVIVDGAFDSQNIAFYDPNIGRYRAYHRDFRGVRDIKWQMSDDFLTWTTPQFLEYPDSPLEHLYTNAIQLDPRASQLYIGFPTRYLPNQGNRVEPTFMASRDGQTFQRWLAPVIPESAPQDRDGNRSNYMAYGVVELPGLADEFSVYATEAYYTGPDSRLRRFVYRKDGYVAIQSAGQGALVTKPILVQGSELSLNAVVATEGSLNVEAELPDGEVWTSLPIQGNSLDHRVRWESGRSLRELTGLAVTFRVKLKDASLYALRFQP